MFRRTVFTVIVICLIHVSTYYSQTYLGYLCIQNYSGYYSEITGGTVSSAIGVDGAENITLPFTFKYMGIDYTTARISTNGWLEMGQTYTGNGYDNQLASTIAKPLICPLWDDLYVDSQSQIRYETIGLYPARIFVVQWKNVRWYGISNVRKNFQVRLWEIDGAIEFSYGEGISDGNLSYSIGLNDHIGGINHFVSLSPQSDYHSPTISTTISNDTIKSITRTPSGLHFTFLPVEYTNIRSALAYQTPDSLIIGAQNQKVLAIILPNHEPDILSANWLTSFFFNTYGTTNTNDILSAKLFYTGTSPVFSTEFPLGSPNINPGGTFAIGNFYHYLYQNNVVHYFWLAYSISPNANSGNIVDANCTAIHGSTPPRYPDTSITTAVCILKQGGYSGNFAIGSSGHFNSLTQAINTFKNSAIRDSVFLNIQSDYNANAETFPIVIPRIPGTGGNATLTIRPEPGNDTIVISSNASATIKLNNTNHVMFRGFDGVNDNIRRIIIRNTSVSGSAIQVIGQCYNNEMTDLIFEGSDTSTAGGVIVFKAENEFASSKENIPFESDNYNNKIINSIIQNYGNSLPTNAIADLNFYSTPQLIGNRIENCIIKNFTQNGIYGSNCKIDIISNTITNDYPVPSSNLYGIRIIDPYKNFSVRQNKIVGLVSSLNSSNKLVGMFFANYSNDSLINNFISLNGNPSSEIFGIEFDSYSMSRHIVANNTILIGGSSNGTNISANLFCSAASTSSQIKNNLFINRRTAPVGIENNYLFIYSESTNLCTINFNNYFNPNGFKNLFRNIVFDNLETWKTLTGFDFNSISKNIHFVSGNDLHLSDSSLGDSSLIGTPLSYVVDDIDGELRHPLFPYMGADESTVYPLPVEIISFTGSLSNVEVKLNWHTASELNNKGFEIQRSVVGGQLSANTTTAGMTLNDKSWENIGFVNGAGTTTNQQNYFFSDDNVSNGKYFYRLKQIDFDGSFSFSNEIEIDVNVPAGFSLEQNYPNPFNPSTIISYQLSASCNVSLKIFDVLGNEVTTLIDNEFKEAGYYNYQLSTVNFPLSSGIYFCTMSTSNFSKTIKMTLLR